MSGPRRAGIGAVMLRVLPGTSPLHRLRAETKIVSVAALTLFVSLFPGWPTAAVAVAVTVLAAGAGRVPRSVIPRVPWWLLFTLAVGAGLSAVGGGLGPFFLFLLLGWILIVWSLILGWTTPTAQLAPAMSSLLSPLGRVRLPVAEWVVTIGLCVRSLPLLNEELRVVVAARRMRAEAARRTGPRRAVTEGVGLICAVMVVSIRRAADMGRAIQTRGGISELRTRPGRPGRADVCALCLVGLACLSIVVLAQLFPSGY